MHVELYGHNQVQKCKLSSVGQTSMVEFAECSYNYYFISLQPGASYTEDKMQSFTVLCLRSTDSVTIVANDQEYTLSQGDSAQLELSRCIIKANGNAEILVAGVLQKHSADARVTVTMAADHKKVVKPWGHELWFNGEHPGYCLKEVMINQGFRTSLQYHNFKEETNVLYQGSANLVYKNNDAVANDDVTPDDLGTTLLDATSVVHVVPKILHRLEAVTDVLLYETSTPYLDDVIRVQDDKLRYNGRVASEHSV